MTRLEELSDAVEATLETILPGAEAAEALEFGGDRLVSSMRYSLETPGKRLRPLLLLTAAEAVGADATRLLRFAASVEMVHAYSLIHDDLPAMDDDDMRRGLATNHVVYGDGMAILAGDGLLTEAVVVMLEPVVDPALQMEVVREVARAAGFEGMVGGQAADLLAEGELPDESLLRSIHSRKTGALIRASVDAGARLGGASAGERDALAAFADRYGIAFQIADDVKDEVAPLSVTGKNQGGDREAGKMTYPALFGVDGSRERCRAELDAAFSALAPFGDRVDPLVELARDSVAPAFAAAAEEC
jgi:geranylgeranyl diphosphate synthase type II